MAFILFRLHFNLSTAGSLELLLVVLTALRLGFWQATVVSVLAVGWLNLLFMPPIFRFTVADPENWVSLATFEATALVVSRLASKVRENAARAENQRTRTETLYQLSRAILLIDGQKPTGPQLEALIGEIVHVERAEVRPSTRSEPVTDADDFQHATSRRALRLGTTVIGTIVLNGWQVDGLLADAVASLAAIAIERARAVEKENRAEAARNTEQLRSAVLDGLAHAFKTPLTAIQTASSGLLAIGGLSATQAELVELIDERADMLAALTTRLLQTAALEARDVRLRRTRLSVSRLAREVVDEQQQEIRERIQIDEEESITEGDGPLIKLAILQLIDNAAKYSAGAIHITIRRDELETVVIVANTGEAIRPEEQERIFDRFYRGIQALRGPTGTGLGLSIVKKTAEAHAGRAWVECDGGETRFFFTLPVGTSPPRSPILMPS